MSLKLIHGCDFGPWVLQRVPYVKDFGAHLSVGIGNDSELLAAAVYYDYHPHLKSMQIAIAADSPRWATPYTVRELLAYPFEDVGCVRLTAFAAGRNLRSIKLIEGVGFKREGVVRKGFVEDDMVLFGMLREEWQERWEGYHVRKAA